MPLSDDNGISEQTGSTSSAYPRWAGVLLSCAGVLVLLGACATMPVGDRERARQEINDRAEETIAALAERDPELQTSVETSVGYFVGRVSGLKIPVVGGGYGLGVLFDKAQGTRTYMNVRRFDLGIGLGAGSYRLLILFETREAMETFRTGVWQSGWGAESAAGSKSSGVASNIEGTSLHLFSESGAALVAGARLLRMSVNHDLTDAGASGISIPNTEFTVEDRQGDDAPRIWPHKMPFLAQKVIDLGYDLPLPYGVALTYADVDQAMLLDELEVGINGGAKEPFDFVAFENASADSESIQLKVDTWLFPFMNVFALLGTVDGKAPLDVLLDGNGMLDQLGIDCSGPPPRPPLCNLLEDRTITLPIEAGFSGKTYGVGTVLAGGWRNFFATLPISFTYANMDTTETEGIAITVTPRLGGVLNLGNGGHLALFAGGNYLEADLTVTGTVSTPDGLLVVDYTVDQRNKDRWNLLVGGNWDINKHWSWSVEYDGFIGSREALITSVTLRY